MRRKLIFIFSSLVIIVTTKLPASAGLYPGYFICKLEL